MFLCLPLLMFSILHVCMICIAGVCCADDVLLMTASLSHSKDDKIMLSVCG